MNYLLTIDAGNTRIKWGVHDGKQWLAQGSALHAEASNLAAGWPRPIDSAIVSNVAGKEVQQSIQQQLNALKIPVTRVVSTAAACGVKNGYDNPAQLGTDRWAAMIATWQRYQTSCVVVSAGTALTVDALSFQGEFLGGLIVPGLHVMHAALASNTAGLSHGDGKVSDFPTSTSDAMHSGALYAMTGAVSAMLQKLQRREDTAPRLILTGGDAHALQAALSGQGEIVDNLVLEGLVLLKAHS